MSILNIAKNLGIVHNVSFRVIDTMSGKVTQQHKGHNAATNSMLTGIAHYLIGEGVLNQGYQMLSAYVPKYISLGTMGLIDQSADDLGLPANLGVVDYNNTKYNQLSQLQLDILKTSSSSAKLSLEHQEILRCVDYMTHCPGYGADGYDEALNNGRSVFGLGPVYGTEQDDRNDKPAIITSNCELISDSFPRAKISFRDVVPESESEMAETIDVVFSAMISTGALAQFRAPGNNYIFITEAGLWSHSNWNNSGDNGLLAGYRIAPPNQDNWDMSVPGNRNILKRNVLRVGVNQVVQVIWKIQLGSVEQLTGMHQLYPVTDNRLRWELF